MARLVVWQMIPHLALGGATRVALWLARGLDPERFAVKLLAGSREAPEGDLEAEVRAWGLDLELLPDLHRDPHPLADWRCRRQLAARLRRERPDILHAHGSKALVLAGLAARGTATRMVATAHGWPFHEQQRPPVRAAHIAALRHGLRQAAAIIAVSQATRQQGLQAGIGRPDQYHVIYPGADLDAFSAAAAHRAAARAELGLPTQVPVIGSVMRLSAQKAPLDFVRAAALVAATHPEAHFVVIGSGPLREAVAQAVVAAGLTDRFRLVGARHDVPYLLGALDIFALSSLWEGLPIVYAEASAAGLPIVGTAVAGAAELVRDGVTGRLVPPGDPAALAQSLSELLANPERARAMGAAARQHVRGGGFSVAAVVAKHEALYEALSGAG